MRAELRKARVPRSARGGTVLLCRRRTGPVLVNPLFRGQHLGWEDLRRTREKLGGLCSERGCDFSNDVRSARLFATKRVEDPERGGRRPRGVPVDGSYSSCASGSAPVNSSATSSAFSGFASIRTTNAYGVSISAPHRFNQLPELAPQCYVTAKATARRLKHVEPQCGPAIGTAPSRRKGETTAMTDQANQIAALLQEAGETHHLVYRILDGTTRGTRTGSSTCLSCRRSWKPPRYAASCMATRDAR